MSSKDKLSTKQALEAAIRIGFVALLLVWCFEIIKPFIIPVLWGGIIAVAVFPLFRKLRDITGQRTGLAALLFTLIFLVLLIVPVYMFAGTLVEGMQALSQQFQDGKLIILPPPEKVSGWPIIGESLDQVWSLFSTNLQAAVDQFESQFKKIAQWLLSAVAGAGLSVLQFIFSIIIAGIFLANHSGSHNIMRQTGIRLAGERGAEFVDLAGAIIRSVAQGVLGIALIQSVLAGLGMVVVGVPAAGLWALIVLFLAVVQLPPILILVPIIIYVFSTADTTVAVIFMIWSILVSISDSFLKPLLLGRGLKTPMLVILLGAIGGMMMYGIIGLFVGSVVLSLSHELFLVWLYEEQKQAGIEDSR